MSNDSPTTTNENAITGAKTEKKLVTWVFDILIGIGALSQVVIGIVLIFQLSAYRASNDLTRQSLELSRKNSDLAAKSVEISKRSLELTDKSIELTQRSTELSQRNVELAQKNLDAVQQGLQYASKANEISKTGLETANMPSLDVNITGVGFENGPLALYDMQNAVEVRFSIENHSDAAATKAFAQCFLENMPGKDGPFGIAGPEKKDFAVMPHQTEKLRAKMFTVKGRIGAGIIELVNSGKIGVKVYVSFSTSLGKKGDFIETFYKSGGRFTSTNTEIDPPEKEISDLIAHSIKP